MGMAVPVMIFVGMAVQSGIRAVFVEVGVPVFVFMGVDQFAVAVLVSVGVTVLVGMLQRDAVSDQQDGGRQHNGKCCVKLQAGSITQQQHAESDTQKRCYRVESAGFGGAQILLRHDIKVDAQAISHKAQHHGAQ